MKTITLTVLLYYLLCHWYAQEFKVSSTLRSISVIINQVQRTGKTVQRF